MNIDGGDVPTKSFISSFIDEGSSDSQRYYLSRRTVLEMLRDRGYSVPDSEIKLSLQDFRNLHGQNPDPDRFGILASHQSNPAKQVLVGFCGRGVVKVNTIRNIPGLITNKDTLTSLILVVQSSMTDQAMKTLELFSFKVEIFEDLDDRVSSICILPFYCVQDLDDRITDLLINITKHELSPKHRVLTNEEKEELLKKYSVEEKQLPRITVKDALARYFALEMGQVVEITYNGEITEFNVTNYRCVWL